MLGFDINKTIGSQLQNFFIRFSSFGTIHQDLFFGGESDFAVIGFGMKVEPVKERTFIEILVCGNFEKILFPHLGVSSSIVPTKAGVASLDQAVNPNIFDNVEAHHGNMLRNIRTSSKPSHGGGQVGVGGMQSMRHFVTDKHVCQFFAHVFPYRHREGTGLNVKRGRRGF